MTLLVGDSLAVGVAAVVHVRHEDALRGRGSRVGAHRALRYGDRVVWVSLGANDPASPTREQRRRFRGRVRMVLLHRECVAWLRVPSRPWVDRELRAVAAGDARLRLVSLSGVHLSDGVHPGPAGYRLLARRLRRAC